MANAGSEKVTVADEERELETKLAELRRTKHPRALLEALDGGFLPQGVRLVHPDNHEDGVVLTFSKDEAATLVEPLKKIVAARK